MKRLTTICSVAMKKSLMITLAGLLLTAAGTANADFTPINTPWDTSGTGPEQNLYDIDTSHTSILNTLYDNQVTQIDDFGASITDQVWLNLNGGANVEVKYAGYIARQQKRVEQMVRLEGRRIPRDIDYGAIRSLSAEGQEKLTKYRPLTLGQAGRIAGVSPADVAVLMIYMKKHRDR